MSSAESLANSNSAGASLRWKVRWMYLTPCQKWQERKVVPFKLMFHIVKIVLVTTQVLLFGVSRISTMEFYQRSTTTFKHLYLKDWDVAYEALPYPPAGGPFAVYSKEEFRDSVLFTIDRYNSTDEITTGSFTYWDLDGLKKPANICKVSLQTAQVNPANETFLLNPKTRTDCFNVSVIESNVSEIEENISKIDFNSLEQLTVQFYMKSIHLQRWKELERPECVEFKVTITYDNRGHDGQILVSLDSFMKHLQCSKSSHVVRNASVQVASLVGLIFFRCLLVSSCVLSTVLCLRSIYKAQVLKTMVKKHLRARYSIELTTSDTLEFLNVWYIAIVICDVFILVGTSLEIAIEQSAVLLYNTAAYFLGSGALIAWFSIMRYLGYFQKYNVLILSMKRAVPNVMRFLVCAGVLFGGYTFTGWVVFGATHLKFRTISDTCENLFAMLNGDELFVTFSVISDTTTFMWFYSRLYLYSFNSLFIFFVLNIFIAIITDSYETIKHCKEHGFPKSTVEKFAYGDLEEEEADSMVSYPPETERRAACMSVFCCQKRNEDGSFIFF